MRLFKISGILYEFSYIVYASLKYLIYLLFFRLFFLYDLKKEVVKYFSSIYVLTLGYL
jgi:hypothetical protein